VKPFKDLFPLKRAVFLKMMLCNGVRWYGCVSSMIKDRTARKFLNIKLIKTPKRRTLLKM
jgi:hypothetical protein